MEKIIYIKAPMSASVSDQKVCFKDILEVEGTDEELVKEMKNQVFFSFHGAEKKEKAVFTIMKVIHMIEELYPDVQIVSVGEPDFIVEYKKTPEPEKWQEMLKLLLLCAIVFIGSAFTIMTFNTDVSVTDVFDSVYQMFMGERKEGGSVLEIFYCIGIFTGIMGFYNHFTRKKLKQDPTPIHVEMRNYEEEVNKAIMGDAAREGTMIK